MKMKLSSVDVLQIAKALKCGWLDTDKIASFRSLVDGYNPPREIKQKELDYYLACLYKGWGYEPTEWEQVKEKMLQGLNGDLLEKLMAIKALGGTFTGKEPDFSFTDGKPPKF